MANTEQALKALERLEGTAMGVRTIADIQQNVEAIRAALAQPSQEPAQRTGDCLLCGHCAATGQQIAHPQPSAPVAQAVPAEWRKFVEHCSKTAGCMVEGNNLSRLAFRLLSTAPQVEQVEAKEGWKLVPVKLTDEMRSVLTDEQITAGAAIKCDCPHPKPIGRNAAIDVFEAMLAAAPSSQKEGEQKNV